MNRLNTVYNNMAAISGLLRTGDKKVINAELDRMINTVKILYSSKQDYIDNFPAEDDTKGKIKLIVNRRR